MSAAKKRFGYFFFGGIVSLMNPTSMTKKIMKILTHTLALIALLSCCGMAQAKGAAKTDKEARKQFKQGITLYKEGKGELAAIAFERAYELNPSYKILYNIGQVENHLEHYAAAFTAYNSYLDEGGDKIKPKRRKAVETEIERLETLVGYIQVVSPVDGARVKINSEVVGATPLEQPLLVDTGKHEVTVQSDGEDLLVEVVKVAGGETITLTVEVKEEPEPLPVPTSVAVAPQEPRKRVWTWVAGGIGVASGIAAAVTGGIASSRAKTLEKNCTGDDCLPDQWDTLDSTRALATTTNVLIGVAAAGVAAGVALFFVEPRLGREETPVVAPVITEDSAFLSVTGRF